jgi:hypothetical protein
MSERPPQPPPTQYETDEVAKKSEDVPKRSLEQCPAPLENIPDDLLNHLSPIR